MSVRVGQHRDDARDLVVIRRGRTRRPRQIRNRPQAATVAREERSRFMLGSRVKSMVGFRFLTVDADSFGSIHPDWPYPLDKSGENRFLTFARGFSSLDAAPPPVTQLAAPRVFMKFAPRSRRLLELRAAGALLAAGRSRRRFPRPRPRRLPAASGPIVRQIDVQYVGRATVTRERILANMRTAVGQPFNQTGGRGRHPQPVRHGRGFQRAYLQRTDDRWGQGDCHRGHQVGHQGGGFPGERPHQAAGGSNAR